MRIITLLILLLIYISTYSQDTHTLDLRQHRIKTNLTQIALNDFNLSYEYVYDNNTFGIGCGYMINDLYKPRKLPEINADRIIDLTCLISYNGPNAQISYKRFIGDYLLSDKKYLNCDFYYKKNDYDNICIYYGSNGLNAIKREQIAEKADLIGVRCIYGKELTVNDYWFFEISGGIGYVFKFITRNTISAGFSGGYNDITINQETTRQANHLTLQFGIKTGLIFEKRMNKK